jgi:DNA-binding MarR family transcriptional regulator
MSKQSIGYLLHHISAVLARNSDQILQEQLGIGFSQFKILLILQQKSGVQQKQIATALGQTEASISRQIRLLQDSSLLTSMVNPNNRRKHIIQLTPKGLKVVERAMQILNGYHAPVFARLNEKQQNQLVEMLSEIHKSLCIGEHDL